MTDMSHLAEGYRERAFWPDKDRIAWIRQDRWLGFRKADAVRTMLSDLLEHPPRTRMPCLLVFGKTGMGKSHIVQRFAEENPPRFDPKTGVSTIPVVAVQLPPEPTESEFYDEILGAIGAGFAGSSDVKRARQLTRRLMSEVGARMLILDEVNHMLACTPRQQRIFLNTIRYFANDLRMPLVCTGNNEARSALLTDAALADRFDAVELSRWQDDEQFELLMVALAAILPLRQPSPLAEERFRAKVIDLTDGNTGRIFRLIENLAVSAIKKGTETIAPEDLDADDLVLPTVTMKEIARRQGKYGAGAVPAV
jgi:hypothetical protein